MKEDSKAVRLVTLDDGQTLWSRVYTVAPLVIVGTREGDGYAFAPKHMASPMGWDPYFGFVCTPRHATYRNAREAGFFTVTYPKPSQVMLTGITARPRHGDDRKKPELDRLPRFRATEIDGEFLQGGYFYLECKMDRVMDGFGKNSLLIGYVMAAHVDEDYLRKNEGDDERLIQEQPLLAYLSPGRYAEIRETNAFPFPAGFKM